MKRPGHTREEPCIRSYAELLKNAEIQMRIPKIAAMIACKPPLATASFTLFVKTGFLKEGLGAALTYNHASRKYNFAEDPFDPQRKIYECRNQITACMGLK